ncbi:MarR family winged helix-turn-helix transcriptional regulator [Tsuneonella sp. HG222]
MTGATDDRSEEEFRLTIQLVLAGRRWRSLLDEQLRPLGQSSARMEALSAIRNSTDGCAQVDVARRLRIEGPTLTRMIDTLERDGLVERLVAAGDRRTKRLRLTGEGEATLDTILATATAFRARMLSGIDEGNLEEGNRLLEAFLDRLDAGLPGDDA